MAKGTSHRLTRSSGACGVAAPSNTSSKSKRSNHEAQCTRDYTLDCQIQALAMLASIFTVHLFDFIGRCSTRRCQEQPAADGNPNAVLLLLLTGFPFLVSGISLIYILSTRASLSDKLLLRLSASRGRDFVSGTITPRLRRNWLVIRGQGTNRIR